MEMGVSENGGEMEMGVNGNEGEWKWGGNGNGGEMEMGKWGIFLAIILNSFRLLS